MKLNWFCSTHVHLRGKVWLLLAKDAQGNLSSGSSASMEFAQTHHPYFKCLTPSHLIPELSYKTLGAYDSFCVAIQLPLGLDFSFGFLKSPPVAVRDNSFL